MFYLLREVKCITRTDRTGGQPWIEHNKETNKDTYNNLSTYKEAGVTQLFIRELCRSYPITENSLV